MIDHAWSVLCSNSIIDRESNNISLIDILEQWNLPPDSEFPVVIGNPFVLVTMWSRANLSHGVKGRAKISIRNPNDETKDMPEYEIGLENHGRFRHRSGFQGFQLISEGKYVFDVFLLHDGEEEISQVVASVPLEVRLTDPENPD